MTTNENNSKGKSIIGIVITIVSFIIGSIAVKSCISFMKHHRSANDAEQRQQMRTEATGYDVATPDATTAHEACLRFFDTINSLDCDQLDASVSQSIKDSCRRYPMSAFILGDRVSVFGDIMRAWGYCDADNVPVLTFSQFIAKAMEMVKTNDSELKLQVSARQFFNNISIFDKEVSKALDNIKKGRPFYEGLYPEAQALQIIFGYYALYGYAKICMLSPANTCSGYDSVDMDMLSRILPKMQTALTNAYAQYVDLKMFKDLSVATMFEKPLLNAIAYYYKNQAFPSDLDSLLSFSDFECSDPKLLQMLLGTYRRMLELDDLSAEVMSDLCTKIAAIPTHSLSSRAYHEGGSYSEFDGYSYMFLRNPQKYRYEVDGTVMRLISNGLDAQPNTDDDEIMTLDARYFVQ